MKQEYFNALEFMLKDECNLIQHVLMMFSSVTDPLDIFTITSWLGWPEGSWDV